MASGLSAREAVHVLLAFAAGRKMHRPTSDRPTLLKWAPKLGKGTGRRSGTGCRPGDLHIADISVLKNRVSDS